MHQCNSAVLKFSDILRLEYILASDKLMYNMACIKFIWKGDIRRKNVMMAAKYAHVQILTQFGK